MGNYLFIRPDVNNFFTSLRGLPNEEIRGRVETYMDANPQVESEIKGIRQPLTDLRNRCDAPAPTDHPCAAQPALTVYCPDGSAKTADTASRSEELRKRSR